MPDVTRSDSQRSDASLRPRVSFNRDVHVKRIVAVEPTTTTVRAHGAGGGGDASANHPLFPSPVRKERVSRSRQQLADEAARVLQEVENIDRIVRNRPAASPTKFHTLPARRKHKINADSPQSSTDRRKNRRRSIDSDGGSPPRKPPRTFAYNPKHDKPPRTAIFNLFGKKASSSPTKKSNLKRSASDVKSSPAIGDQNKENDSGYSNDVVVSGKGELKGRKGTPPPEIIVIDVDSAKDVSGQSSRSRGFGGKLKVVKAAIDSLRTSHSPTMIHSSQKPVEKLPLTRGLTVDTMVRRLNNDKGSPSPPHPNRPSAVVVPNVVLQHNNNQPFSYTRGQSPERVSPVIYAHVVCDKVGGPTVTKQTVHAAYTNGRKHPPHSDSDEGLGTEEGPGCGRWPSVTRFGDEPAKTEHSIYVDSSSRGRGDGMDSKRRESLTEPHMTDLSARRDLLESRINRRSLAYRHDSISPPPRPPAEEPSRLSSSPENPTIGRDVKYAPNPRYRPKEQKLSKEREHYQSNPEIVRRTHRYYHETYHDSLKRHESAHGYFDRERRGDSGIERDSGETQHESEDEGFASSLLIASERQHTEDNVNGRRSRKGTSGAGRRRRDEDPYRNLESMEYRTQYAPRERSIDDGSHYDPRIDRDHDAGERRKMEKKPPKPEKRSSLEKMKQLFSRDKSKKTKEKKGMVPEENLRSRYTEYRGSREHLEPKATRKIAHEAKATSYSYADRRRMSTPSPSPTREAQRNGKTESPHTSWFKSLDRLSRRKKTKKDETDGVSEEEQITPKPAPAKNLRFFGDTDIESNDSLRHNPSNKTRPTLREHPRSQSTRDLHHTSVERNKSPEFSKPLRHSNHRSLLNVSEDAEREPKAASRLSMKPPMSPNHRAAPIAHRGKEPDRSRRRRNEINSVESSTEGDSSQQSQRSVVYLHAATVGDIPGPGHLRHASREELAPLGAKTLSRSFSVLAPWRPRHARESLDIDYSQQARPNGKHYEQKPNKLAAGSSSTLKKRANETRRTNQHQPLGHHARSKEHSPAAPPVLRKSAEDVSRGSGATLYRKRERQSKENPRYGREKEERRVTSKSVSVESLGNGGGGRKGSREVSRSISMPRDPEKSAGWFRMNKKSKK